MGRRVTDRPSRAQATLPQLERPQARTLATTYGTVSHVGDGELTLAAGFGWSQLSGDGARRSAAGQAEHEEKTR